MMRREQFATDQRKSRKKDIIQSKRELYSCKTPVERSVSPMFGGRSEASRENEEVKQIVYDSPSLTDVPNGSDIRDVPLVRNDLGCTGDVSNLRCNLMANPRCTDDMS